MKKFGFTLMEVNLAVFIMATGVLAMVALYPLGFRENQQSVEDVGGAALAEEILNPVVAALSSTNMTWSTWQNICGQNDDDYNALPNNGWRSYFSDQYYGRPISGSSMSSQAKSVIGRLFPSGDSKVSSGDVNPSGSGLYYALVATHPTYYDYNRQQRFDPLRIGLCLRVTRRPGQLMSQPVYYTEVRFQGDPNR